MKIKYFFILFLIICCINPTKVLAIISSGDYSIESYNINIVVNEDNSYDITEEIKTFFEEPKHRNI